MRVAALSGKGIASSVLPPLLQLGLQVVLHAVRAVVL